MTDQDIKAGKTRKVYKTGENCPSCGQSITIEGHVTYDDVFGYTDILCPVGQGWKGTVKAW